jgi:hypothetical protein
MGHIGTAEQAVHPRNDGSQDLAQITLDTTAGSLLHRLAAYHRRSRPERPPSAGKAYAVAAGVTYVPLLIAALLSPLPVASTTPTLKLPFLYDWNIVFMVLVSFPSVIALTVTDQYILASALRQVQLDGIISMPGRVATSLSSIWQGKFRLVNIGAQSLGVVTGICVAYFNYVAYIRKDVGFWAGAHGHLFSVGIVFLGCIFLFYWLMPVYVARSFAMSFFLRDVVTHAQMHLLPFHPDRSGGLRPVGRLGLRNQYALTVAGVNVVLLVLISIHYLVVPSSLRELIVAAAVAYVILGPLVFLGPLLPFRVGMLKTKTDLMSEVAQRLRLELQRLRQQLAVAGPITQQDEELIDRLRKVGAVIDELPVWPFDTGTLRKFLTAYITPLLGTIGYPLAKAVAGAIARWLR